MNVKKLSRKGKEELYKKATANLQHHWGNPVDDILDFSNLTDNDLEEGIKNSISQLKFEKVISPIEVTIKYLVITFVVLGMLGLLVFGIKQLF